MLATPILCRQRWHVVVSMMCIVYFVFYSSYSSHSERNLILVLPALC